MESLIDISLIDSHYQGFYMSGSYQLDLFEDYQKYFKSYNHVEFNIIS